MRFLLGFLFLAASPTALLADDRPRLLVQLIFDQMRGDYLIRWHDQFTDGGFRRLTADGAWFQNCHYPYANTITGPGHATLSTGCPPAVHGIIGNDWYDRKQAATVNCVAASRFAQVPPAIPEKDKKPEAKGVSPQRLLAPTFADALKDQLGDGVRVVALSLKDRSSVLPGGLRADACYWTDKHGRVVTSTYYRDALHPWVKAFNAEKFTDRWHGKDWLRLRSDLDYVRLAGADDVKGEGKGNDQGIAFPHHFGDGPKKERTNYYAALGNSPQGNEVLLELAKRAIDAEKLGQRGATDYLSISFSSNDIVGHTWGPDSQEVLDTTLRSDLIVKELLTYLDEKVGKGKYAVAISADHGVCPLPEVSRSKGINAHRVDFNKLLAAAEDYLDDTYPGDAVKKKDDKKKARWVTTNKSNSIYLNRKYITSRGLKDTDVAKALASWLAKQPGIEAAFTRAELRGAAPADELARMVWRSYFTERSGDVAVVQKKYCLLTSSLTGTSHGTPHAYDTWVPLVAMGPGIKPGVRKERVSPEHMAVILSQVAGIKPPAKAKAVLPEGVFAK